MNFFKTCWIGLRHLTANEKLYFESVFFVIVAGILFLINEGKLIIGSFQGVIFLFSFILGTVGLIIAVCKDTKRRFKKSEKV